MTNLQTLANKRNVEYIDKGNGHIQLKGALLVNYYPESKKRSAYVAGTTKRRTHVTPEQAIEMCFKAPKSQGVIDKRPNNSRRVRKRLLARGMNKCCWCEKPLTLDNSTIEHVIPLARGGLDNDNNRKLACHKCNHERGNNMPELNQSHD